MFKAFSFTEDAKKKKAFAPSRKAEERFLKQLLKVARNSSKIVNKHVKGLKLTNPDKMDKELAAYARRITKWAEKQSNILVLESLKRIESDEAYKKHSREIAKGLQKEILHRDVVKATKKLFKEQVGLFKSIPIQAGERAHEIVAKAMVEGRRANELALELNSTLKVTESRARLIARTETARTNTALNKARAESVGSEEYFWRNSQDEAVRHSHEFRKGKKLDGQRFRWDTPPELDDGTVGHPGTFPNCRCYPEAIFE